MTALAGLTWTAIDGGRTVLVPVGSVEQHGPHLPLDTDSVIASAVADRAAEGLGAGVLVAPPMTYGSSGEHQSFAGTCSIGTDVLRMAVVELVRSMRLWAQRVVLVNAHGGNRPALVSAVTQLLAEGHDVAWIPCATEDADLHAGFTETSLMLHLRPAAVRLELASAGDTRPLRQILPQMVSGGVAAVSPNGVLGDPTGSSPEAGAQILSSMVEDAVEAVRGGQVDTSSGRIIAAASTRP